MVSQGHDRDALHADCIMPVASEDSPWRDLPFDLLEDISGRLHAATDYVRFHAACKPWRHSLPPPARRPTLLPWLLSPRAAATSTGHRTARCVLSSSSSTATTGTRSRQDLGDPGGGRRGLLARNLASALSTLSPDHEPPPCLPSRTISQRNKLFVRAGDVMEGCCVAYNSGNIVLCRKRNFVRIVPAQPPFSKRRQHWSLQDELGGDQERFQSRYLVESRGELLLACVEINNTYWKSWECHVDVVSLAKALSVSVYVLQDDEAQGVIRPPPWVKRDGWSFLADHVLFLGRPSSFAAEAARLVMDGGCAYFLDKRWLNQGNVARDRCRLLKYSFHDNSSEFVEELPAQWTCKAGMWIMPKPVIATSNVT
ncbi:unnamed protein product [Urochloa decumbens]|uniref:KIB1-4 beta-propeller domain-containing protein n=1 Tax=Urochloa decumbens TaxID=240449 RepID=A0ABC9B924_9POAL